MAPERFGLPFDADQPRPSAAPSRKPARPERRVFTVTELTAPHVAVDRVVRELEPGRKPFHDACEARAVRLAGSDHS